MHDHNASRLHLSKHAYSYLCMHLWEPKNTWGPWEPSWGSQSLASAWQHHIGCTRGETPLESLLIDTIPDRHLSEPDWAMFKFKERQTSMGGAGGVESRTPLTQTSQSPADRIAGFQKCMLLPPTTIGGCNSQTLGSKSQSEATNLPLRRLHCISDAPSIVFNHGNSYMAAEIKPSKWSHCYILIPRAFQVMYLKILDSAAIAIIHVCDYIWVVFSMTEHLISPQTIYIISVLQKH